MKVHTTRTLLDWLKILLSALVFWIQGECADIIWNRQDLYLHIETQHNRVEETISAMLDNIS